MVVCAMRTVPGTNRAKQKQATAAHTATNANAARHEINSARVSVKASAS